MTPAGLASAVENVRLPLPPLGHDRWAIVVVVRDALGNEALGQTLGAYGTGGPVHVVVTQPSPAAAAEVAAALASGIESAVAAGDADAALGGVDVSASLLRTDDGNPCASVTCSGVGVCDPVTATCVCNSGYAGDNCETTALPNAGGYGAWAAWGACDAACGGGVQVRTRVCDSPSARLGGATCVEQFGASSDVETRECNTAACGVDVVAVNGGWSAWSGWGACSTQCAPGVPGRYPGTQRRSRSCSSPPKAGTGAACSGPRTESQACNTRMCPGPIQACPGSSHEVDAATGERASQCSGHGTCARFPDACVSSDPVCLGLCMCGEGWAGVACELDVATLSARQTARSQLVTALQASLELLEPTPDAMDRLATTARRAVGWGSELTLTSTLRLFDMIDGVATERSALLTRPAAQELVRLSGDVVLASLSSLLNANATSNATGSDMAIALSRAESTVARGNSATEALADVLIATHAVGEAPLKLPTPVMGLTIMRDLASQLTELLLFDGQSRVSVLGGGSLLASAAPGAVLGVRTKSWLPDLLGLMAAARGAFTNSSAKMPGYSALTLVTDVKIVDVLGREQELKGLLKPLLLELPLPWFIEPGDGVCSYFDIAEDAWTSEGVATLPPEDSPLGLLQGCATTHLSSFTVGRAQVVDVLVTPGRTDSEIVWYEQHPVQGRVVAQRRLILFGESDRVVLLLRAGSPMSKTTPVSCCCWVCLWLR